MAHVIIGTAGHIDHGKSSLVRALTGTDPDRLPEEKKRQITIDLGYAFLDDVAAIIDVPGHEKFIRNMVAGAATIDYAILVIAADDGIMPQTREHLEILKMLDVKNGVVALTKADIVEKDWLELVEQQIKTFLIGSFLENRRIFSVDSISENGIPEFRNFLLTAVNNSADRSAEGVFRLPVDRVFSVKGRGTVITGTILSGQVNPEEKLVALPGEYEFRVKGLETHSKTANNLKIGQRAALNLMGETERLERGLTLALPNSMTSSTRIKVTINLISQDIVLKDKQRIRFLIGTQECIGRLQIINKVSPLKYHANILLETPAVAAWGDRFILRRYSPVETLGGGKILESVSPRLLSKHISEESEISNVLDIEDISSAILAYISHRGKFGIELKLIEQYFGVTEQYLLNNVIQKSNCRLIDKYVLSQTNYEKLSVGIHESLVKQHSCNKDKTGFTLSELQIDSFKQLPESILKSLLDDLVATNKITKSGSTYKISGQKVELTEIQQKLFDKIDGILRKNAFSPPSAGLIAEQINASRASAEKSLVQMEKLGLCKRLGVDLFFNSDIFENSVKLVCQTLEKSNELSVADTAKLLSSSRKYVVPFLEYLDQKGITARTENIRVKGRNFVSIDKN